MNRAMNRRNILVALYLFGGLCSGFRYKNASEVRGVLEKSGRVMAVFQGHNHKNEHREVNGIHYCTLTAMVEGRGEANDGYAILTVEPNGNLTIDGFRKQANYKWG